MASKFNGTGANRVLNEQFSIADSLSLVNLLERATLIMRENEENTDQQEVILYAEGLPTYEPRYSLERVV